MLNVILSCLLRRLVKTCRTVLVVIVVPSIIVVLTNVGKNFLCRVIRGLQRLCSVRLVLCIVGTTALMTWCSGRPVDRCRQARGLKQVFIVVRIVLYLARLIVVSNCMSPNRAIVQLTSFM